MKIHLYFVPSLVIAVCLLFLSQPASAIPPQEQPVEFCNGDDCICELSKSFTDINLPAGWIVGMRWNGGAAEQRSGCCDDDVDETSCTFNSLCQYEVTLFGSTGDPATGTQWTVSGLGSRFTINDWEFSKTFPDSQGNDAELTCSASADFQVASQGTLVGLGTVSCGGCPAFD